MSVIRSALLEGAGVRHGFGTTATRDSELPSPILTLQQVHGNRIVVIAERDDRGHGAVESVPVPGQPHRFTEGDALISTVPGTFVGVRTADCLPVLLTDPLSGIAAAIHCGWRSPEVMEAVEHLPGAGAAFQGRGERLFMDLAAAARGQLLAQGVPEGSIEALKACTSCGKERFFSHRARADEGRMISFIGTGPAGPWLSPGVLPVSPL